MGAAGYPTCTTSNEGGRFGGLGALRTEMGTESAQPSLDARLAAVARRQYGLVTRKQLRCLGVSEHGIAERIRTRRLHRLHRGVYAVGHDALKREAHWLAAVLACGPGAVLSHASAAAHWGIRQSAAANVDVTVPARSGRRRRKGIRIHRSSRLSKEETTVHEGIATTTVARTLLDLADSLPTQALKRTIDEAEYMRLLDMTSLTAVVNGNPGRRARRVLELVESPQEMTRSKLEQRFLELVERHGLPRPLVNAQLMGYEVDFLWPEDKVIVEVDSRAAHGTREAFERDRLRDRRLLRAGYRTVRVTDLGLRYDEDAIAADLDALVSRSRCSSKSPSRSRTSAAKAR
jgi:predicted transcriptional regulator of viral defense system